VISAPPSSRRFQRCVVRVEAGQNTGTAFLIRMSGSSGLFLTALHVVSSARRRIIRLRSSKRRRFAARIVEIDEARDLALLEADVPPHSGLRLVPVATVPKVGRLTVLQMLDPDRGIVAPLVIAVPFVGETAVSYAIGGATSIIDHVWSQQGLSIPGGTSGAPAVSEEDDAIVAIACAGADPLDQTFFVPLVSVKAHKPQRRIADALARAKEVRTRLGRYPNRRGIAVRAWLQTRASVRSLALSGIYDRHHAISRASLTSSLRDFLASDKPAMLLVGTSGVGKSATLAYLVRRQKLDRPVLLLRAAQIESNGNKLKNALSKALGLPNDDALDELAVATAPAPLLVIDGINELPIRREDWPAFVQVELAHFADFLARKGWKLLISTRSDRLDELKGLAKVVQLYDPVARLDGKLKGLAKVIEFNDLVSPLDPPHLPAPFVVDSVPFFRLESFEREEFDQLVQLYGLPSGLPFSELRHPIVFRLMVEASKKNKAVAVRVRDLFEAAFSDVVSRIHFRCPTKNRDRIVEIIEGWTALDRTAALGQIASDDLGETENEAIAEAAVVEGLLERVPGGYRYIYDEVFDFIRARRLVQKLDAAAWNSETSMLTLIDAILDAGSSPGAVARALEMLSDKHPEALERFARRLTSELGSRPQSDTIHNLAGVIRVLTRVEKAGPLDEAKDQLPLFGVPGLPSGSEWSIGSPIPFWVSDDHISYAFDEDRMWRMVRLSAIDPDGDRDRDSYPFRSKDITEDHAHEAAERDLENLEKFKVLKHFATGFPDRAQCRLITGLRERERIGREHSFASFCAQAIAVYSDRFDVLRLATTLVGQVNYDVIELLKYLCKRFTDDLLPAFLDKETGLIAEPDLAALLLSDLLATRPEKADAVTEVARSLVVDQRHPIFLYSKFFKLWADSPMKDFVANEMVSAWQAGKASGAQLIECSQAGLLSFDQVFALLLARLKEATSGETVYYLVADLSKHLRLGTATGEWPAAINGIAAAVEEGARAITDDHAHAAESLLYLAFKAGVVPKGLRQLIERVCKASPKDAASIFRYPIASHQFDDASDTVQHDLCDLIVEHSDDEAVLDVLRLCVDRDPHAAKTRYIVKRFLDKFGPDPLFGYAKSVVANYERMGAQPSSYLKSLLRLLEVADPGTFQRYRSEFKFAL
jgi:hypothetical protein